MARLRPDRQGPHPAPPGATTIERCWALLDAGAPDEAAAVADGVEARHHPPMSDGDRAALQAVRARCHLLWGDLDAALVLQTWLARSHPARTGPDATEGLVDLMAQLGWRRQAAELVERHGGATAGPMAGAAAGVALMEGRLGAALDLAQGEPGEARARRPGVRLSERAAWVMGAALLEQGHVTAALAPLRTARTLARQGGLQHVVVRAGTALARAHALRGDLAAALAVLEETRRPLHARCLPDRIRSWIDQTEARLLLAEGDVEDAAVVVERLGSDDLLPEVTILQAWTALSRSDPERAGRLLARSWSAELPTGVLIEADILRSRCAIGRAGVLVPLGAAVRRAGEEGYVSVFLEHAGGVVEALRALDEVEPGPHLTVLLHRLDP